MSALVDVEMCRSSSTAHCLRTPRRRRLPARYGPTFIQLVLHTFSDTAGRVMEVDFTKPTDLGQISPSPMT